MWPLFLDFDVYKVQYVCIVIAINCFPLFELVNDGYSTVVPKISLHNLTSRRNCLSLIGVDSPFVVNCCLISGVLRWTEVLSTVISQRENLVGLHV